MTHKRPEVYGIAPLENVARLGALIERCQSRVEGLPGLGCLYGRAGRGKTSAAIQAVKTYGACHVEALPIGGVKGLFSMIVEELGVDRPPRTTEGLFSAAVEILGEKGQPLLIDEADHILTDRTIELIRRLHDVSLAPVILIGEELLPQRLQRWERVSSRVLGWVGMAEATMGDLGLLARHYAPNTEIQPDLAQKILQISRGSHREIATNLAYVSEFAAVRGLKSLDLAAWGDQPFHTAQPPAPRFIAPTRIARRGIAA